MLPNQDHSSIVSTLLVKEVIRYDNRGYGSALAVLLTLLVLVAMGTILGARRLWLWRAARVSVRRWGLPAAEVMTDVEGGR
jgi:ABC-type spermidine/putrescine transport system permease subunit I